jgi:hypothetical protein
MEDAARESFKKGCNLYLRMCFPHAPFRAAGFVQAGRRLTESAHLLRYASPLVTAAYLCVRLPPKGLRALHLNTFQQPTCYGSGLASQPVLKDSRRLFHH